MICVLIPAKSLAEAKTRLSCVFDQDERRRLVLAMLQKVVGVCGGCAEIGAVYVITPDPEIAETVQGAGAVALHEGRVRGLNGAVMRGLRALRRGGANRILVLPGDIPLLSRSDLERILGPAAGPCDSAIAPCHKGVGTNALLIPANSPFRPAFGPGSFRRHRAQLAALGPGPRVIRLPGFAQDIDEPGDLAALRAAGFGAFLDGRVSADGGSPG